MDSEKNTGKGKKSKVLTIIIAIVMLLLGIAIGVGITIFIYEKTDALDSRCVTTTKEKEEEKDTTNTKDDEKEEDKKDEEKEESRELSSSEKKKLLGIIGELEILDNYNQNLNSSKKLTNQEKIGLGMYLTETTDGTYKMSDIKASLSKYFVSEHADVKGEDFMDGLCNIVYMKYDSKKDMLYYNEDHPGHGGGGYSNIQNRFVSGEVKGDEYIVVVYKSFSEASELGYPMKFYASYDDALKDKNPIHTIDNSVYDDPEYMGPTDEEQQKWLDETDEKKLVPYTYTFVKDGSNYKIKTYKIGK